jgi:hypothetical protein
MSEAEAEPECAHPRLDDVPFDEEAARGLEPTVVRKRWPVRAT